MDRLKQLLIKYRDEKRPIKHVVHGGNYGDTLIYRGTDKLLKSINYFNNKVEEIKDNCLVLLAGGGNINDIYTHGLSNLIRVLENNKDFDVVVQPQSYIFTNTDFAGLLSKYKPRKLYLFCREKYSYKQLKNLKLPNWVNIEMGHCPSLYLKKEDIVDNYKQEHLLIALRNDKECTFETKKRAGKIRKILLKNKGKIIIFDPAVRASSFDEFIEIIGKAKKIYTDHLHIGVLGGAIFDREVHLYSGSYYKIKGVYKHSLKDFKNIHFYEK